MTVDEIDAAIERARMKVAALETQRTEAANEAAFAAKREAVVRAVRKAAKDVIKVEGIDFPHLTLWLKRLDSGDYECNAKPCEPKDYDRKARRNKANGNRKSISELGPVVYTLPDGTDVKTAGGVLDYFDSPHQQSAKVTNRQGDAAHRQVFRFVRENPDKAENVICVVASTGETVTLAELVKKVQ